VIRFCSLVFTDREQKFADEDISRALLSYLGRYHDFESPEQMKRVIGLIHRQAIKAKAEGLFFKVSALNLFKKVLGDAKSFPKDQAYTDAKNVLEYVVKKFVKAAKENHMVMIEVSSLRVSWGGY
jgi:replication fork protection complex subunit Tof1/Swi1